MRKIQGSETSQTLKCIANILKSTETIKEVLDGVQWPFGDLYYGQILYTLTTRNIICVLWDTFKSCNLLLVISVQKYVTTHKNYETAHILCYSVFLLTDQHLMLDVVNTTAQCVCSCATCDYLKVIGEDCRSTAGYLLLPVSL